ncbi:glycosyltransferase family 4 protein [Candidatus Micrarchaeota archaeon]|nr:glycosyltransferase family 4 protein [Candidatus Micrarchaeota archaeon]
MDVTIVSHYIDEAVGHGMARYTHNLMKALENQGVGVKTIFCEPKGASPRKSAFDFFLNIPFKVLFRKPATDLYHFAVPQAGLTIPLFKRLRNRKIVTTIYDLHPVVFKSHHKAFPLIGKAIETACRSSDRLIAISSLTKKDIMEHYGIKEDRIIVTPLGVDLRFKPKRKKNSIFTVGYLGGFAGNKNVPLLLKAYSLFRKKQKAESRLVLYGKGAQYDECVKLASSLELKNVEFRGFADDSELVDIYNSFDVFVFPSFAEGFGLPIIEAQKCMTPVITLDGARVPDEVTRYCLKGKDETQLAEMIAKVQEEGFEFTQEHKKHLDIFTWEKCAEETIKAYKEALKG